MSAGVAPRTTRRSALADPRVETLVAWAQTPEAPLDETGRAAMAERTITAHTVDRNA